MSFKVLKHNKINELYGVIYSHTNDEKDSEIYTSEIPHLFPMTASIDNLILYYQKNPTIIEQLKNYELVEVDVISGSLVDKIMVHLDRKDLLSLVKGTDPYYSVFEHPLVQENGDYTGGFVDKWSWNHPRLNALSNEKLVELYYICKNSWQINNL